MPAQTDSLHLHFVNRFDKEYICPLCSFCQYLGRLKLTVLSEDRLQMKWKEADGPVQGYKVRVKPISGETFLAGGNGKKKEIVRDTSVEKTTEK